MHLLGSSYLTSNLMFIYDLSNVYLWPIKVLMVHLGGHEAQPDVEREN